MKAAYFTRTGPPDVIIHGDLPKPLVKEGTALIKINAVSVNPIDTYIRSGKVQMPLPNPYVIGCDFSGVVESVGASVKRFKAGDRVWGSNQGLLGRQGCFAEFASVEECWLNPLPEGISDEQAAGTALAGITAHLGLFRDARIKAGETLFVHGGSGGVGSLVVQMAKVIGANVITTAGTDEKVELCRRLGADLALNYKTQNIETAVRKFAPEGIHVWWEMRREPDFMESVPLLAPRGRLIVMAGRDACPPFPVGPFYVKGCSLLGFAMFNATPEEQSVAAQDINQWLAAGKIRARIDRVMPLSETAEAHRLQESSTVGLNGVLAGKIILKP